MIDPNEKLRRVELVEYDAEWPLLYVEAVDKIKSILGENCNEIHHIGSTAIPNICAKPIIDILPVVNDIKKVDSLNHQFEVLGYVCMGEYGIPGRRFYWKSKEKRTHHIHLFEKGSSEISRHVEFKNFMISHSDYAKSYSLIKQHLAKVFFDDIENYVDGKASFVQYIDYKTSNARPSQLQAHDDIVIQPYHPAWKKFAEAEINTIHAVTNQLPCVLMEHFGSTAVPMLASKPIIDILIGVQSIEEANRWIEPLKSMGYVFWDENPDQSHLRFFKGMPPFGMRRTHHIHIIEASNPVVEQRILLRDILRQNEKVRHEYETLKLKLAKSFQSDREKYTEQKGKWIKNILRAHGYSKPML